MKYVYVEFRSGFPFNVDGMCAADGFFSRGYEVRQFERMDLVSGKISKYMLDNHLFVASTDVTKDVFRRLGCMPSPINFPEPFYNFKMLQRQVWQTSIENMRALVGAGRTLYVKPAESVKLFDCMRINKENIHVLREYDDSVKVLVSTPLIHDIIAEYRIYVHNNVICDVRHYTGTPFVAPYSTCISAVEHAIRSYIDAPVAYTVDVAMLANGGWALIELNDFWSIGSYGIEPGLYSRMLEDRYNQITIYKK